MFNKIGAELWCKEGWNQNSNVKKHRGRIPMFNKEGADFQYLIK